MDLSSLKASLGVKDVRTAPGQELADSHGPGLAEEIFARHRRSTQPESQQLCVILAAVLEVIKSKRLQPTPTALFAALMSSLEHPDGAAASPEVTLAICTLLGAVVGRVPTTILRSRSAQGTQAFVRVLEENTGNIAVSKAAVPCLCQMMAAMNAQDWPAMSRGFNIVLMTCLQSQPKLRKRAHAGLVDVLAGLQSVPAVLAPASEAVLKMCQRVLPGPQAAAEAAAAAPAKKRQQAEEVIKIAVADALHLMGALKQIIFLLSGSAAQSICELLLRLYPLHQPLLSRCATDTLAALCASSATQLSPQALADVLSAVLSLESSWDRRDAESSLSMLRLVEEGTLRVASADAGVAMTLLPTIAHAMVPLLGSQHDGVRRSASISLRAMLEKCVDDRAVAAAVATAHSKSRKLPPLQRVLAAVEASLGPQYRDAWENSLPVAAALLQRIGQEGAPLADGLLRRIGELCAGGHDLAADEGGAETEAESRAIMAAQSALGVALRALGPEAVLEVLPLNLEEGLAGRGEGRTWLIPLLHTHVRGARLGYWTQHLLPMARGMGSRAAAAKQKAGTKEAQVCSALEAQLWATLPSFCSWAHDTTEAFPEFTKTVFPAFEKRSDLRVSICLSLQRLATQTRLALRQHGHPIGFADPTEFADDDSGAKPVTEETEEEEAMHGEVPPHATLEWAQGTLAALQGASRIWLPLLLNAFVNTPANRRAQLQSAIASYACVCDAGTVATLFRSAVTKLMKVMDQAQSGELGPDAVFEGGDSDTERRSTFIEAALSLAGGLDASGIQVLCKAVVPGTKEKDPAFQKKAYKVLAYVCESRPDFCRPAFQEVVNTLLEGASNAVSAAKRYRLRCLKAATLELVATDGPDVDTAALHAMADARPGRTRAERAHMIITTMVSEIILCVKEANKRTRTAAYDLLVDVASAMHEADPPAADGTGGLRSLVNLVLAGLIGSTPHMISASVMSLARLLFEFAPVLASLVPGLLPAVLMLLRSKAREVIKSVLGFVKVVAMRMPAPELQTALPSILEGILLWAEDSKNKFRLKVRVILERLARRCGFEALESAMPEAHRALLTHIRKQHNRRERKRGEGRSEMEWEGDGPDDDTRSKARSKGKTAAKSAWASDVFSEDEGEEGGEGASQGGRSARTAGGAAGRRDGSVAGKTLRSAPGGAAGRGGHRLPSGGDPMDLLDASASRRMVRAGGSGGRNADKDADMKDDFQRGEGGRMVIREEEEDGDDIDGGGKGGGGKRKRGRSNADGFDSDDSDFEDLKGISGISLALKGAQSLAHAPSIAASLGGRSLAKSQGGRSARSGDGKDGIHKRGSHHSGDRFKAKRKNTGGDVKGNSKVEPYAYWPLDRKLLNRRAQKTREAKQGLDKVVKASQEGAARGHKAKRMRQQAR